MKPKKAAVFVSGGLGHGLMMMVASHRLYMQGYAVTTFHNTLIEMRHWFPGHTFARIPSDHDLNWILADFDIVIAEGANREKVALLSDLYHKDTLKTLSIFYPSYDKHTDPKLSPWDRVFSEKKPMVDNIAKAIASLFQLNHVSKNNGLIPLTGLKHRREKRRVILSPTSGNLNKRWTPSRFLKTAKSLSACGFTPLFIVRPDERNEWLRVIGKGFALPEFDTLSELSEMIYESGYLISNDSGIAHLASNLQIPSLIITKERRRKKLWRPGWLSGQLITPSPLFPAFKNHPSLWRHLISVPSVMSHFKKLSAKDKLRCR
jgi:heptosyltransferase III